MAPKSPHPMSPTLSPPSTHLTLGVAHAHLTPYRFPLPSLGVRGSKTSLSISPHHLQAQGMGMGMEGGGLGLSTLLPPSPGCSAPGLPFLDSSGLLAAGLHTRKMS